MSHETAAMFVGVSAGYGSSEAEELSPGDSCAIVRAVLSKLKATTRNDSNIYHVYPGIAVYPTEKGCPKGSEPVAAVVTTGEVRSAIDLAEALRVALKQATVTVASYLRKYGEPTIGFYANVSAPLDQVGSLWQQEAERVYRDSGMELTCGVYRKRGQLVLQAELNPKHGDDPELCKAHVTTVVKRIGSHFGGALKVRFRSAGFIYLTKASTKR